MIIIDGVNISPLLNAFDKFEKFRKNSNTEQEKAGTIQAFEYCFELVWKVMRKLLAERGIIVNSPREVFRAAALEGFIADPELWFNFLKKRNMTVHTYNEHESDEVIDVCPSFASAIKQFLANIGYKA